MMTDDPLINPNQKKADSPSGCQKDDSAGIFQSRYVQWAFILSCVASSAAVVKPSAVSLLGNALAFAVAYYITFHKRILEHVFRRFDIKTAVAALLLTLPAVGFNVKIFFLKIIATNPDVVEKIGNATGISVSSREGLVSFVLYCIYLAAAPAIFVFLYAYIARFADFSVTLFKTSDKFERIFFMTAFSVAVVSVFTVYRSTTAFTEPYCFSESFNRVIRPDAEVVYTFDSALLCRHYYYRSVLHRPLGSLFSLPFISAAWLGSVPFPDWKVFRHFLFCVVQIPFLIVHPILLSRLTGVKGWSKGVFLTLFALSYPALVFALTLEGYIFITFFTSLFLYLLLTEKAENWNTCFAYSAAAGSLLTTGVLVPFFARLENIKTDFINICRALLTLFAFLLFYDAGFFKGIGTSTGYYARFTGITFTFYDKILQFVNFAASVFIKPKTIVETPFLKDVGDWMNYQLAPVESLNIPGLCVLAICFLGFLLSCRDKFARICAFWIAFSFFVCVVVGWGTAENGLMLYSLYFGWAYFCLVFLAMEKLLRKSGRVKFVVYVMLVAVLGSVNLYGMYDLIRFGLEYYPCH